MKALKETKSAASFRNLSQVQKFYNADASSGNTTDLIPVPPKRGDAERYILQTRPSVPSSINLFSSLHRCAHSCVLNNLRFSEQDKCLQELT